MVTAACEGIISDVKAGENVTTRLQQQLSTENLMPRAEKLRLVTTILDHITSSDVPNQHETFLEALRFLRSLVPYMNVKSKSHMDTVASVERYSVNYGLRLIANPGVKMRTDFLHESLRTMFEARRNNKRQPRAKPGRTRNTSARFEKENVDPKSRVKDEPEQLLSIFLSVPKDTLSLEDLHPDSDSPLVASTIAGALTTVFTANKERFDLSQILSLARGIIIPWIEYLYSFRDASLMGTACAYASRINHFLLVQCQTTRSNPFDVFEVRSFAIKVGEVKLNKYAKELLQSANFLLRNKSLSSTERKLASQVVFRVYEDALQFMSTFDAEDPKWFYEDVSAWVDSVFLLWSRKKLFPRMPKLLQRRKSIECGNRHRSFLSLCFSLQEALYKTGVLCEEKALPYECDIQVFSTPTWDKVDDVLRSTELIDQEDETVHRSQPHRLADEDVKAEHAGLESLRLLRVLEPLRQMIVTVPKEKDCLPKGAVTVLRIFLSTILRGLYAMSREASSKEMRDLHEELESRLQKMVGGAIQASRNLLRHYWDSCDPQSFGAVYKQTFHIINQHRRFCKDSARRWQSWVFVPILSKFESELAASSEKKKDGNTDALERVAEMAEVCLSRPSELLEDGIVPTELSSLFEIAREAYACLREWTRMTFVSLNCLSLYSALYRNQSCEPQARHAARTFVEDASNSILKGSSLPKLDGIDLTSDFLLAVLLEYLWWTYSNIDEFKSARKLDQLRSGIQLARWHFCRQCSTHEKTCAVDRLHFLWLLYACEENESHPKELTKNASGKNRCKGHRRSGLFSVLGRESPCTPSRISFAKELRLCWTATNANKFSDAGKRLPRMLTLISSHPEIMDSLELKIASIEILEGMGVKLILHSYGVFARQVGELLRLCRPEDGAPSRRFFETPVESPLLDVSRLLKERESMATWPYSTRSISSDASTFSLVSQVGRMMQNLKSVMLQLEVGGKRKTLIANEEVSCEIAGAVVDIGFHIKNEIGKRSFSKVFLLIHHLVRLAIILLSMENMGDSKYYIERSLHIASCCLPQRSLLLRVINIIHNTICIPEASRRVEVEGNLTSIAMETFGSIEDGTDTDVLASVISELCWSVLDTSTSRFHERLGREPNLPVIDTVKQCEKFVSAAEESKTISNVELRLLMGMAFTILGDHEKALPFIEPLTSDDMNSHSTLTMFSILCLVWCSLKCSNIKEGTRPNQQRAMKNNRLAVRVTRSRKKKVENTHSEKEAAQHKLIKNAKKSLRMVEREDVWDLGLPWIQRRLMSYGGFLLDDSLSEAYRAVLSIGTTFNLRRDCGMQIQNKGDRKQFSQGSTAFRQSSWTSIVSIKDRFQNVTEWLGSKKSVLVSLTIDEERQKILIWRMSRTGTVCKGVTLAETGPVSYHGIISRMEEVLSLAKNGAAKPGQTFSKQEKIQWWEHYSHLDEQMRNILQDIEAHWLGSEGVPLLTPIILPKTTGAPNSRRSKGRTRSNRNAVVVESCETLADALKQLSMKDEFDSKSETHEGSTGHLILMVDTALERIPWESLPVLRSLSVTASRVPSFSYLYDCIREPCEDIDKEKLFYIINPEGDLQRTENHFQEVVNQCLTWSGFSGSTQRDAVASKYNGEEIFLYCGHGSGEQYFSPLRLCRKMKAPVALLMGCSSLRPSNFGIGDQESNGTAINFLIYGAKAVVGNLWDVTDGEVDRLTTSILREWLGVDGDGMHGVPRLSLAEALTKARPQCKFSYLVGAACVVIGVPHAYATC